MAGNGPVPTRGAILQGLGDFDGAQQANGEALPMAQTLVAPPTLSIQASPGLAAWLRGLGLSLSLGFSTYRANRLLFLGTAAPGESNDGPPQLKLHERLFDCQIWRLDNLLGPGQSHGGGDRLYVPAVSFTTGDVNAHEVVLGADGQPIFVNTAFSCLATLAPGCSFAPFWQPHPPRRAGGQRHPLCRPQLPVAEPRQCGPGPHQR